MSPGLVPWLLPMFVVLLVLAFGLLPWLAGLAVVLGACAAIGVVLRRANQGIDYIEMRREDALFRGWEDFRRGRGYRGLDSDTRVD